MPSFRAGERIERADFTAEVRSITRDGRPLEVAFHFRTPLQDPHLRWLTWTAKGPRLFPLPSIGETVDIDPISLDALVRASIS